MEEQVERRVGINTYITLLIFGRESSKKKEIDIESL